MPDAPAPPLGRGIWNDTRVELPAAASTARRVDAFATSSPAPMHRGRADRRPRAIAARRGAVRAVSRRRCSCRVDAMLYLTIIGGAFIAWLILAVLFTPHIPYHIEAPIDAAQRSLHPRARVDLPDAPRARQPRRHPHQRRRVLPGDARRDRGGARNDQHGVLHLQEGRDRRPVHRGAVRARPGRRARHDRDGRDRQLRRVPQVVASRCEAAGCRVARLPAVHAGTAWAG